MSEQERAEIAWYEDTIADLLSREAELDAAIWRASEHDTPMHLVAAHGARQLLESVRAVRCSAERARDAIIARGAN